eukprot:s1950_g6.t2
MGTFSHEISYQEEYNTLAMPGMAQPNTGEVGAVSAAEQMNRLNRMNPVPLLPTRPAKMQPDARQRAASPTKETWILPLVFMDLLWIS